MNLRAEIAKRVRSISEVKCSFGPSWDKAHKDKSSFLFSPLVQWVHKCCSFRWGFESRFLAGLWVKIILGQKGDSGQVFSSQAVSGFCRKCFLHNDSPGSTSCGRIFFFLVLVEFINPCWIHVLIVHFLFSAGKSFTAGRYWGVCRALYDF